MEIFFRLLFGHFLADFTFQTNFIADWKRRSIYGLLVHILIHPVCYVILAWPFLGDSWVRIFNFDLNGFECIALATFLHFLEDWFRVRQIARGWTDNTFFYIWDQAVHILVLVLLTPIKTQPLVSTWPILGILFVIVTHFATVTIWFIEKDIFGRDYPATEEKYISILQRLVIWLAFFLPQPWWIFVVAIFLLAFVRHVWSRRIDFSWTSVVMGNVLAIACGAFSRFGVGSHL
jgi:hypothetical protein